MSRSKQAQLNQEIREFIAYKDALMESYTEVDCEYLMKYTGSGGLIKQGASGRGVLYEYYTPDEVVKAMWGLADKHGFKSGRVLEPSVGIGRFLRYADPDKCQVDAYEFSKDDNTSARICEICFPWVNLTTDYFESIFYQDRKRVDRKDLYDLVIGNPPYGKFSGYYSKLESKKFNGTQYDQYFIWAGIELLKPGGLLVMVVPSALHDNTSSYQQFKRDLMRKADFVEGVRLPYSVFDFTDIQTDILVMRKK